VKSNQITAIPALLELLDIKAALSPLMPWRSKAIATDYPQGDYVLTLKANHGKLHHAVQQWFEQERTDDGDCQVSFCETLETGHRIETRH